MGIFDTLYLGNDLPDYLLFFATIIGSLVVAKIITWTTKKFVKAFAKKTKTKADDLLVELLEGPVLLSVFIAALHFGQHLLNMSEQAADFYNRGVMILLFINIAWYLVRFINGAIIHYIKPLTKKTETDLDDHLLPLMRKLVNFLIYSIVLIMVIDKLGFNVSSLLAGLGIGGLAFALAAQDLVGNLFGGIAILMDKPFKIGDRIKVGEVDGYVREIGLRTTRVETFGGTMMVLPNSKVVDSVTENVSAEKERRMVFTIGVEYGTTIAKLEKGKELIVKNIKAVKGLNHKEYNVQFVEFDDSSLNLRIQYWITMAGMDKYFDVQDELNMGIKRDFEKAKIEMAFPTQTVHVKK
ncbi:mechanosensitive ion channel family protein [Candidatus Woesearchaeota archaeon]|nr:mechanosensitive ion channel family protein [Candidatus Woesearchaeota archaeon]